jgi:hypothetical protein
MPNADQRPRSLRTNKSRSDSRECTTCLVEDIARQSGENRCRGQTAVKHAKRNPQPKRGPGFKPMGRENRRLAGSWVMNSGKQRQLSDIGASLIRMRSLVQIQAGPPPRTPSPPGFSPFLTPPRHRFGVTAVKHAVKHAKHLPRKQPPQSRCLIPADRTAHGRFEWGSATDTRRLPKAGRQSVVHERHAERLGRQRSREVLH